MIKVCFIITSILILILLYFKISYRDMTYVKSDIDGRYYLVRDLDDKQQASNILARIRQNIERLISSMENRKNEKDMVAYRDYIEQLSYRIQYVTIIESTEDSIYTSYTVNKGEQIVFCLRSRRSKDRMHDINLMMYVVLHEISHIACPEYGHTNLFKKIFAFITNEAVKLGIYHKIDFENRPEEYCGMMITESVI